MTTDFTQSEIDIIKTHVDNRWRDKDHGVHLADIEITAKDEKESKPYPAAVWEDKHSTFIVIKLGAFTYKSFFYFLRDKRFDTGVDEYNDLDECVDKLLKAQADFMLSKSTQGLQVETNKSAPKNS